MRIWIASYSPLPSLQDRTEHIVENLGTNDWRVGCEPLYLFSADADTNLTGYSHGLTHEAAANGISFGRYLDSVGDEFFPAQINRTLGTTNSGPRVGPVVINEIMYHPPLGGDEFVELRNITATNVPLYDVAYPTNTWKLNGLGFSLPPNLALGPGKFLLLVPIDPSVFRARYNIPGSIQVIGPYFGSLQNDGENLQLQCPDSPDSYGVPYITVDAVRYRDREPWPAAADGTGLSLQRKHISAYGNDPVSWVAESSSPGVDFTPALAPSITAHPTDLKAIGGTMAVLAAGVSGQPPIGWQWLKDGLNLSGATNATLTLTNLARQDSGAYSALATNPFGRATSQAAWLRVLVPQRLEGAIFQPDGVLELFSRDADGGILNAGNLNGFTAETSTNLVNWAELSSALSVTNGYLLLRDANATNQPLRFYRILER